MKICFGFLFEFFIHHLTRFFIYLRISFVLYFSFCSDFDKMHDPSYGYVQLPTGLWDYTLLIDESKKPSIIDVVEWGGACLNHLTPDVYSLEMFKVTRV